MELRCPGFQTGCIYGWTKETPPPPSPQGVGSTDEVPVGSADPEVTSTRWFFAPLDSPSPLPIELPSVGLSQDAQGTGHAPCPSSQTRPENMTAPTPASNKETYNVWGYWLIPHVSFQYLTVRMCLICKTKKKLKEVDCVLLFFQIGLFS